jgi:hypothetical protein
MTDETGLNFGIKSAGWPASSQPDSYVGPGY